VDAFSGFLRKNNVPLGDSVDPLSILATDAQMASWNTQGLPSDRISGENGAIMTNSERWCLIIDPQMQGIVWIRKKEEDNKLQITRMGQKKMLQIFEQSIDNGASVLIENMGEGIDAVLQPVIARNTLRRGSKKMIKLGDKEINYSPNFRLFMQTKLSNPHYPPEIQAECTLINFTVTEAGLEDQLLFLVVVLERPDLARTKSQLIQQQNEFKVKLAELEALLLEKLANAEGDILDDADLIIGLEDAKKTSDDVKEKAVVAQETQARIDETMEFYRPAGSRGALFFFLMMDLAKCHSFYKFSLDSFVVVVTRAVNSISLRKPKEVPVEEAPPAEGEEGAPAEEEAAEPDEDDEEEEEAPAEEAEPEEEEEEIIELTGKELTQRVVKLSETITMFGFNYTRRGLFDTHKLTVASLLMFRLLQRQGKIDKDEMRMLVMAPVDPNAPPVPDNVRDIVTDMMWSQLRSVENVEAFKKCGSLTSNMESDSLGWKRWYAAEKAEAEDLPRSFRDLSSFHRLMLLRIMRPDRLGSALTEFVHQELGTDYIDQPPFDMEETYAESSNLSPFFFVLFPGSDPTPMIESLAKKLGKTSANGGFVNISMGQGQEDVAITALKTGAEVGNWVYLANIHLMQAWLKDLERCLEIVDETSVPEFRVFLSSEPPSASGVAPEVACMLETIPEPILQKCIKVSDEAPQDLKSNLRRAYSKFSPDLIDECAKPKEFKACLFALCFFHALVLGRRRFGPQGYSRNYPFNDGDLTISGSVLKNYLNAYENVPWPDLRYMFGDIMYGGHITDPWDRRCTNAYLQHLIVPDLLANMNLAPGSSVFKSPDASKLGYAQYQKYIEEKFPGEAPQMFGLHSNAEIGYLTNQGNSIFGAVAKLSGGGGGGGGGGDIGASTAMITNLLATLPLELDMFEIRGRIDGLTPYVIVSLQESERMNVLLAEIKRSLLELELGISGALNVTDMMEALAEDLQTNKVNAGWEKRAYPSLKPLSNWFADLILRVAQLKEWTDALSLLKSLWVAGFFNPMSFLTAVMQVNARATMQPLDFQVVRIFVTNARETKDLPDVPAQGVYIHGFFMEGAGWEEGKGDEEGYITDSKIKDLHPEMPIINAFAILDSEMSWENMYNCPIFVTAVRGATFVLAVNVRMDADDFELRWILAGAAFLLSDDSA